MQRILVIFLLTIVMLQSGIKAGFVAYYQINRDYIAAMLCENKENIAMNCKGKCYLNKKIKEQETADHKLASILKELKDTSVFLSSSDIFSFQPSGFAFREQNTNYFIKSYPSPLTGILQPPC
jgi:hypothetical protein